MNTINSTSDAAIAVNGATAVISNPMPALAPETVAETSGIVINPTQ